jgi:hypothetical protein
MVKPSAYHSLWDSIGRQHAHYAAIVEAHPDWWERLQKAPTLPSMDDFRKEMQALVREYEEGQFDIVIGQLVAFDAIKSYVKDYKPHPQGAGRYYFNDLRLEQ